MSNNEVPVRVFKKSPPHDNPKDVLEAAVTNFSLVFKHLTNDEIEAIIVNAKHGFNGELYFSVFHALQKYGYGRIIYQQKASGKLPLFLIGPNSGLTTG